MPRYVEFVCSPKYEYRVYSNKRPRCLCNFEALRSGA